MPAPSASSASAGRPGHRQARVARLGRTRRPPHRSRRSAPARPAARAAARASPAAATPAAAPAAGPRPERIGVLLVAGALREGRARDDERGAAAARMSRACGRAGTADIGSRGDGGGRVGRLNPSAGTTKAAGREWLTAALDFGLPSTLIAARRTALFVSGWCVSRRSRVAGLELDAGAGRGAGRGPRDAPWRRARGAVPGSSAGQPRERLLGNRADRGRGGRRDGRRDAASAARRRRRRGAGAWARRGRVAAEPARARAACGGLGAVRGRRDGHPRTLGGAAAPSARLAALADAPQLGLHRE